VSNRPKINQIITHYKIASKPDQGGMDEVYRATDTRLEREVAIKVLPKAFAAVFTIWKICSTRWDIKNDVKNRVIDMSARKVVLLFFLFFLC
jgi:hypothetical protein